MIKVGDIVGGRYRIERQIGEGGMASVWLGYDTTLTRKVAIKFVWQRDPRRKTAMVNAFLREARIAASIVHRNVVQVLDFGLWEDSTPYMVMEALEGETLGDLFNAGAQFTLPEVSQIASRSLDGLIAVHEGGIVHRDLKPENIFLLKERDGYFPKLLDFGISRSLDRSSGRRSAVTTQDGRIVGTPEYMSPEQAAGTAAVDRRTDIYSMGVILYETIVGDVPYRSDHLGDLILQITAGRARKVIELVPEVGQAVSDVIDKAMRPDPKERFADAVEMYEAWNRANEVGASRTPSTLPERKNDRRQRTVASTLDNDEEDLSQEISLAQPGTPGVGEAPMVIQERVTPKYLPWALAAVVAIAGVALYFALRTPATPSNKFIVVQSAGEAEQAADGELSVAGKEPEALTTVAAVEPPAPEAAEPEEVSSPKTTKPAKAARKRRVKAPSPELSIARAFNRQKGAVVRCFEAHTEAEEAQLAVRLEVDTTGSVKSVSVSPERYNTLQVGQCIRNAVERMHFAPQSSTRAFRVPLIARRGS